LKAQEFLLKRVSENILLIDFTNSFLLSLLNERLIQWYAVYQIESFTLQVMKIFLELDLLCLLILSSISGSKKYKKNEGVFSQFKGEPSGFFWCPKSTSKQHNGLSWIQVPLHFLR